MEWNGGMDFFSGDLFFPGGKLLMLLLVIVVVVAFLEGIGCIFTGSRRL